MKYPNPLLVKKFSALQQSSTTKLYCNYPTKIAYSLLIKNFAAKLTPVQALESANKHLAVSSANNKSSLNSRRYFGEFRELIKTQISLAHLKIASEQHAT